MTKRIVIGAAIIAAIASLAAADDAEAGDRRTVRDLRQEIAELKHELIEAQDKGMEEARTRPDGQASPVTEANMRSLQSQMERKWDRMWQVACRHGWTVDRLEQIAPAKPEARQDTVLAATHSRAFREHKRAVFAREAKRIAAEVKLPATPTPGGVADRAAQAKPTALASVE